MNPSTVNAGMPAPTPIKAMRLGQRPASPAASLEKLEGREANQAAKEQFNAILGELLFHEMLKSMRRTVDEPAYFHGGQAEEVFTGRLDQVLAQKLGETHGEQFLGPMYDAWSGARR